MKLEPYEFLFEFDMGFEVAKCLPELRLRGLGVKRQGTTPQGPTTLRVIEEDPKLNPKIAKLW